MDFNHRKMTGFVIEVSDEKPEGDYEIKSILKVIDKQDVINDELIRLSRDMSYLYKNSMGQCLSLMVPNAKRDSDAAPFFEEGDFSPIERLSEDQERVIREYHEKRREGKTLFFLHGVTGSGKSEVYLRLRSSFHVASVPASSPACRFFTPPLPRLSALRAQGLSREVM